MSLLLTFLAGWKTHILASGIWIPPLISIVQGLFADPFALSVVDINTVLAGLGLSTLRVGVAKVERAVKK